MTSLGVLWFVLIAILLMGYFILDGFDLGVGALYPFLGRDEESKSIMRRAIGPVWDGNEVWLLTAGGALFAAFPAAYATSFSGFYLAIMLVLFGLIIRAVALEFRGHAPELGGVLDLAFFVGSLLPALLFGVAVGNIVEGVELNANGDYIGGFFALLNPFALLCGILGLTHMLAQGAAWIASKAPAGHELRDKAARLRPLLTLVSAAVFVIVTAMYLGTIAPNLDAGHGNFWLAVCFAGVYVLGMVMTLLRKTEDAGDDVPAFIGLAIGCVGLVGILASTLFPCLIVATDPALSITVANAQSSDTALFAMAVIACIGVPLVLVYHVFVYRLFRGRVGAAA